MVQSTQVARRMVVLGVASSSSAVAWNILRVARVAAKAAAAAQAEPGGWDGVGTVAGTAQRAGAAGEHAPNSGRSPPPFQAATLPGGRPNDQRRVATMRCVAGWRG